MPLITFTCWRNHRSHTAHATGHVANAAPAAPLARRTPRPTHIPARPLALLLLLAGLCGTQLASAQTSTPGAAGEVEFARGVGYAQTPGQGARILGKGLAFKEGDTLSTAAGSTAIIRLQDGSRMTLRPGTDMVVQTFKYRDGAADNSMVMQLFTGGLRAITGLIAKSSPDAARLQTKTATVGIRGTDFDARICQRECNTESSKISEQPRANAVQASAKLLATQGEILAVDASGQRRRLVDGGSVYPGETVETGAAAKGVLAFRDDSRLTLGATTRFRVDTFVFDDKNPTEGKFLVSLLRGSARALTGLIGRANNRNVAFTTPTATVGIRGTGLDMECDDAANANCSYYSWLGSIDITPTGQSTAQVLNVGQGLQIGPAGARVLSAPILENLQRPDNVPVNIEQLFSSSALSDDPEGLYVFVRDGHIEITTAGEVLQLGRGETGFVSDAGRALRPNLMPLFMEFDNTLKPNSVNPMLQSVLNETIKPPTNQCR